MGELSALPNISKVIEEKLNAVGISSMEQLRQQGSKEAFTKIWLKDHTACINMLMAIEGAIEGVRWHHISEEKKAELKGFYNGL